MKRKLLMRVGLAVMAAVAFAGPVMLAIGGGTVEPASCTFTNMRDQGQAYVSDVSFYRGTTLLLTNCVILSGSTTSSTPQNLDGVTIDISWGTETTNHAFTGTVQVTNAGTWWCSLTVPTNWEAPFIEVKITDANTNSYIYPWKLIHTKSSM